MNTLVFAMMVACATAQWLPYHQGIVGRLGYAAPYWGASQYHAQDELGQASYGYAYPGAAASNFRDAFGNQVGSYAYVNPEGKEVKVSYTADSRGFRVVSNDLPVAPVATISAPLVGPAPVQDEPAVVEAKIAHARAMDEAKSRGKRQVLVSAWNHPQFNADLLSKSVDLNQDGQPDIPVVAAAPVVHTVAAPVHTVAALPYTTGLRSIVSPITTYSAPVVAAPVVAKTTVNTLVSEIDETKKTPADTKKVEDKIVSHEVVTPIAHSIVAAPIAHHSVAVAAPLAYSTPLINTVAYSTPLHHTVAYSGYPWISPMVLSEKPKVEDEKKEDDSVKVESARKKRQVLINYGLPLEHPNLAEDFAYSSTDLNRDGMPDSHQIVAPIAYSALPYTYGARYWY